jgi:regulatory protein
MAFGRGNPGFRSRSDRAGHSRAGERGQGEADQQRSAQAEELVQKCLGQPIAAISNPSRGRIAVRAIYVVPMDARRRIKVATAASAGCEAMGLLLDGELAPGSIWTQELATALASDLERRQALMRGLNVLSARAMTTQRFTQRLKRMGFSTAACEHAVSEATRLGLLDDVKLAGRVAEGLANRKTGVRRIEQKLRASGVQEKTARSAARKAAAGRDAMADAEAFAMARLKRMPEKLDVQAKRRRLFGQLARRGFEMDVAREVVERVVKGSDKFGKR